MHVHVYGNLSVGVRARDVCMEGGLRLIFSVYLGHFLSDILSQGLTLEHSVYQFSWSRWPACSGHPLSDPVSTTL